MRKRPNKVAAEASGPARNATQERQSLPLRREIANSFRANTGRGVERTNRVRREKVMVQSGVTAREMVRSTREQSRARNHQLKWRSKMAVESRKRRFVPPIHWQALAMSQKTNCSAARRCLRAVIVA
jgi:hypothetical protein